MIRPNLITDLLLPLLLIPLLIALLYPCLGCHGRCCRHGVRRQSSFVISSTGLVFTVGLFLSLGSVWFVSFLLAHSSVVIVRSFQKKHVAPCFLEVLVKKIVVACHTSSDYQLISVMPGTVYSFRDRLQESESQTVTFRKARSFCRF